MGEKVRQNYHNLFTHNRQKAQGTKCSLCLNYRYDIVGEVEPNYLVLLT